MKTKNLKNKILPLLIMALGLVTMAFYNIKANKPRIADGAIFDFKASPYPPGDVAINATDTALAAYAWLEFLALNWKCSDDARVWKGVPDLKWTYSSDAAPFPDTVVWETYAHRSELSPYVYPMRNFDAPCKYSYKHQPVPGKGSPSFGLLNNLDETSEIGSCNLFAFANKKNLYIDTFMVRYQAKTNRIEYDYIKGYANPDSLQHAVSRTKQHIDSAYRYAVNTPDNKLNNMLDLPNGAIEVKSAWRPLKADEDPTKFFTRKVIVYSNAPSIVRNKNGKKDTVFTYYNKLYALIGLHIIHKSKNHPSFVFATWEHVDVTKDTMKYVLLTQQNAPQTDSLGYMTPTRHNIIPIDELATTYVHSTLLPKTSVWQNYRLVGVQGTPTNNVKKPNFFLANYVIESDKLLARFRGSGFSHPFNTGYNVYYNKALFSVGGCQGCHGGGAQHSGTDFSFIVNSPNDAPDPVAGAPLLFKSKPLSTTHLTKLGRLKRIYH